MKRLLLAVCLCALVVPVAALADDDPVITVPPDMTIQAQNFSGAAVTYTASAVDRRGRPIPITCVPGSGTIFGFGETRVTCTAIDSERRQATKRFRVTVIDTQPPAIHVPGPKRVTTKSSTGAVVTYSASASDVVDGPVPVACTPASGTRFAVGTTNVACNAADVRGNRSSAAFQVTVVHVAKRKAGSSAMLAPRPGARVTTPPTLRWRAVRKARFYNIQLYRQGQKVLSAWPTRARLRLHARWRYKGHTFRLRPASYTWLVWPAFGSLANPRFGKALGVSNFIYARRG
jgi:hypothetical protein